MAKIVDRRAFLQSAGAAAPWLVAAGAAPVSLQGQQVQQASDLKSTHMGERFRALLRRGTPFEKVAAFDTASARLVEIAGFQALFLGSSRAAESYGLPDWGLLSLSEQAEYFGRIASNVGVPAVADIDINGDLLPFYRSVRQFEQGNVAALHFGDAVMFGGQQTGMHPVVTTVDRIRAARDASPSMVVSVRCQGVQTEGFDRTIERAAAYVAAGAETVWLLPEPPRDRLRLVAGMLHVPVTSQFGFDTPIARARDWNVTVVLQDMVTRLQALWYEALIELKTTGTLVQSTRGGTLAMPPDARDKMRNLQALTDIARRLGR